MNTNRKIDWVAAPFLTLTPLAAIAGVWIYLSNYSLHWATLVWTFVYFVITGLAITAGYHRLFSHKAFKTKPWIELPLLLFGTAAFQNSLMKWATDHRRHHRKVDTKEDPYSIQEGFWFAHWGWILTRDRNATKYEFDKDLVQNPRVRFQKKFYIPLAIFMCFIFPAAVASFWGDAWGGFVFAGLVRLVVNHHFTFFINSACHKFGTQPYGMENSARDAWWLSLFTYGEGYHNFHHHFQADYRNGVRWYDFDPTKWLISVLAFFKQATDLRFYSEFEILRARMRTAEAKARLEGRPVVELATLSSNVQAAYERWVTLQQQFSDFKESKGEKLQSQFDQMNAQMNLKSNEMKHRWKVQKRGFKIEIAKARREFKENMWAWRQAVKTLETGNAAA